MKIETRLPDPGPEETAISSALTKRLRAEIRAGDGFLPFDRFMELALYAPGLGYYVAGAHKFGREGDFVTAPELSPLFGACLARQCAAVLESGGEGVIEFGGGSGRLALSVMQTLRAAGYRDFRYAILELSPELRVRQAALIAREAPELLAQLEWWQGPPAHPWHGTLLANEILDAIPVSSFELQEGCILERGVVLDSAGNFLWQARPAPAPLAEAVRAALPLSPAEYPQDWCSEINLRLPAFMTDLTRFVARGAVVLADYGYPRAEFYHPDRAQGTLQCYYRHRVHADPLWMPGIQDITAAVDFTAVAEAADEAGWSIAGFAEQAQYLMACGITDLLAADMQSSPEEAERRAQAVKRLLLPQEMGTRVKIMTLTREHAGAVTGYALRDARHRL